MASLNPPQAAPKWTHTPEEVLKLTKDAIAEFRALEDSVAALKPEECNFDSVRHTTLVYDATEVEELAHVGHVDR